MATASSGPSRMDFVFMLVALYFILISFFIILSTLSVKDSEKLQSAVTSITRTFKVNDRLAVPSVKQAEPTSYTVFLNDLQGWIGNLYAIGNVSIVRRGNQIAVTIRHPRFFLPNSAQFSAEGTKAVQSLADLLSTWQSDYLAELEVVADEPADPGAANPPTNFMGARHAGAIAAYLTERGILPQAMAVTAQDNPETDIAFTFIIRIPPKING